LVAEFIEAKLSGTYGQPLQFRVELLARDAGGPPASGLETLWPA